MPVSPDGERDKLMAERDSLPHGALRAAVEARLRALERDLLRRGASISPR